MLSHHRLSKPFLHLNYSLYKVNIDAITYTLVMAKLTEIENANLDLMIHYLGKEKINLDKAALYFASIAGMIKKLAEEDPVELDDISQEGFI